MIQISLENIGKKYRQEWVFKGINLTISKQTKIGIVGSNGSGKSTLLKLISAAEFPSSGKIKHLDHNSKTIEPNDLYQHLSYSAPYAELPDQLTPNELFTFHTSFKQIQGNLTAEEFLKEIDLASASNKLIKDFSSGMKQRLKLGLSICSAAPLLILDEPCSNLDGAGVETYHFLLDKYGNDRTILIGSNEQKDELYEISDRLNIMDYK